MSISVESMREHTAELVAGLVRLREWLESLAEDQVAQALSLFRSEVRRTVLALTFAVTSAFFLCAAGVMVILSIFLALGEGHRVLAGAVATALCASLAIGSLIGLRRATRPARRGRAVL